MAPAQNYVERGHPDCSRHTSMDEVRSAPNGKQNAQTDIEKVPLTSESVRTKTTMIENVAVMTASFTVTEAIEATGFGKFQFVLCAICGLSWVASSSLLMLFAILGPSLKCEWQLTDIQQALCTGFVFAGWMVSSPVWGRICDVYGRRKGLMATNAVGFIFGIASAIAPNYYIYVACRFAVGFASFFAIGTAVLTGLAIFILPNFGWRYLVAYAAFPIGIFGLCCWWMPESVRFDVTHGKIVEARATLDRVARFNGSSLPAGELVNENQESSNSNMSALLQPSYRRTTLQLWCMWMLFAMLYYGIAIYTALLVNSPVDQCGVTTVVDDSIVKSSNTTSIDVEPTTECRHLTTDNYIDIITTTMSEVPGYIITMYAIDSIGRRGTFAICFAIVSACSAVLTICVPRWLTIAALFVCKGAIGSVYQTGYIYSSEVYPTALRAQGLGVASGFGRFGSMITPMITRMLFAINLIFPAIVFICAGIVGAVLSILLPIETKPVKVSSTKAKDEKS